MFEIKYVHGDSMPFSAVRPHQKSWLLAAMGERPVCWKIPDVGAHFKPFDVFMVGVMDAYVVIRYASGFVAIGADRFFDEEKSGTSLKYDRAMKISAFSGDFL